VRCFSDPDVTHVGGKVDPLADIETIEMELMFADIQTLENALPKAERAAKGGDKEAKLRVTGIQLCMEQLNKELPLRKLKLEETIAKAISSYGLMTAKPILYIANVDEDDLQGEGEMVTRIRAFAEQVGAQVVPVCAKLEAEIAELDEPDRSEMLASVGLQEPALQAVARKAYQTLGLQSYFTAGEKEVRAWTVPVGATAPQGAGVIHTDFERGFIRCEVFSLEDLEKYGTEKEIRQAGKLRTEGKTYVMQDGDICHFLFNV
jgi:GTP-binding protein YchF